MLEYNYKSLKFIDKILDIVSSIVVNMIVIIMGIMLRLAEMANSMLIMI